jgi:hypothetical protein
MSRLTNSGALPKGWLAFELNILSRLKFGSAALPIAGDPALGAYLKRWGVRVVSNDLLQSNWTRTFAFVQNNAETLTEEQAAVALYDAYVPRHRLYNPARISSAGAFASCQMICCNRTGRGRLPSFKTTPKL